jgi:hypothetical protein
MANGAWGVTVEVAVVERLLAAASVFAQQETKQSHW